eukprot:10976240-Alexandrium_andersonii.AAC.1
MSSPFLGPRNLSFERLAQVWHVRKLKLRARAIWNQRPQIAHRWGSLASLNLDTTAGATKSGRCR